MITKIQCSILVITFDLVCVNYFLSKINLQGIFADKLISFFDRTLRISINVTYTHIMP